MLAGLNCAMRALPRPPAFDFKHQRPTQEGPDCDQTGQHSQAHQRGCNCNGLDDIGRHHDFQPEQKRAPDADLLSLVVLLRGLVTKMERCPSEAAHDHNGRHDFNAKPDHAQPMANRLLVASYRLSHWLAPADV